MAYDSPFNDSDQLRTRLEIGANFHGKIEGSVWREIVTWSMIFVARFAEKL
jgi:hypothetical protein